MRFSKGEIIFNHIINEAYMVTDADHDGVTALSDKGVAVYWSREQLLKFIGRDCLTCGHTGISTEIDQLFI